MSAVSRHSPVIPPTDEACPDLRQNLRQCIHIFLRFVAAFPNVARKHPELLTLGWTMVCYSAVGLILPGAFAQALTAVAGTCVFLSQHIKSLDNLPFGGRCWTAQQVLPGRRQWYIYSLIRPESLMDNITRGASLQFSSAAILQTEEGFLTCDLRIEQKKTAQELYLRPRPTWTDRSIRCAEMKDQICVYWEGDNTIANTVRCLGLSANPNNHLLKTSPDVGMDPWNAMLLGALIAISIGGIIGIFVTCKQKKTLEHRLANPPA